MKDKSGSVIGERECLLTRGKEKLSSSVASALLSHNFHEQIRSRTRLRLESRRSKMARGHTATKRRQAMKGMSAVVVPKQRRCGSGVVASAMQDQRRARGISSSHCDGRVNTQLVQ